MAALTRYEKAVKQIIDGSLAIKDTVYLWNSEKGVDTKDVKATASLASYVTGVVRGVLTKRYESLGSWWKGAWN